MLGVENEVGVFVSLSCNREAEDGSCGGWISGYSGSASARIDGAGALAYTRCQATPHGQVLEYLLKPLGAYYNNIVK